MKKSEISLAIMVLKYGLDYLQYLWDPLIAFFMAEFPSQAHFLGLTHVSGQKRAPGHGTPFCALVQALLPPSPSPPPVAKSCPRSGPTPIHCPAWHHTEFAAKFLRLFIT